VSVFTDRLGSWRLFYTELADGTVVFSSAVQSLAHYPPVSLAFHEEYLVQHLTYTGGPYGVKTPLRGVETYPPGTVTTYDLSSGTADHQPYWRLRFDADENPLSYVVDEFVDRFRTSVRERTRDRSKRYGLLLSGGSDARLVLGALDDDVDLTAYHMAEWMSKEARIAEQIAMAKGVDFRFLRREDDYFERLLDRTPAMWNFQQQFQQAWADGFIDQIRSEVDVLLTGHFLDTMFKGLFVPTRQVNLGPLGRYDVPVERQVSSIDEYVREFCPRKAPYVDSDVALPEVLDRNLERVDGGVEAYGVRFDSVRDFVLGVFHYPATTDSFFRQSLRDNLILQTPVLDNRLIDLWVNMPTRYQLRHNIVGKAAERLDPELAAIPHATSGVPVRSPKPLHWVGSFPMNAISHLSPFDTPPIDHVSHGPWGHHVEMIRTHSYVEDVLEESEALIRALPFLDWEAVQQCYRDHLDGENYTRELYRLVTLLNAPVTRQIAGLDDDSGDVEPAVVDAEP
jgi:asparagine synthase (glutamine-hydrolysing)